MTEEAQRIAIAEACGWRVLRKYINSVGGKGCDWILGTEGEDAVVVYGTWALPDYLHDLNAMHEAEKMLTEAEQDRYAIELSKMVLPRTWPANVSVCPYWLTLHTTAAQRAEAFLRAIG